MSVNSKVLTYTDNRKPKERRRHSRKRGWRPSDTINVNIMIESYDIIKSLAQAKGQTESPFYEEAQAFVNGYCELQEKLAEKEFLLDDLRKYNHEMKERLEELKIKLDTTKRQEEPLKND